MKRMLILSALATVLAGLACGRHSAPVVPPEPAVQVRLAAATPDAGAGWIAVTLTATRKATLSTRMAASVQRIRVNEGQQVAAGALLISLADEDLQAGLQAALAAEAAAAAHHRRIEALLKQEAAIPAEMDEASTGLAQARAAVAQVRANLGYTQIRAPFAGVIQSRMVDAGAFVGPGTPLLQLEGQGALELDGTLSEAEARGLRIGMRLPFEVDGRAGRAEITALATGGDPVSHRGTLRARILKGGPDFRTGSFARLRLPQGPAGNPEDRFVPGSALVRRGELSGVFVARDGKAELRWLSLGEAQGDRVPVRAGLAANDAVIAQPDGLHDGQPVEVLR